MPSRRPPSARQSSCTRSSKPLNFLYLPDIRIHNRRLQGCEQPGVETRLPYPASNAAPDLQLLMHNNTSFSASPTFLPRNVWLLITVLPSEIILSDAPEIVLMPLPMEEQGHLFLQHTAIILDAKRFSRPNSSILLLIGQECHEKRLVSNGHKAYDARLVTSNPAVRSVCIVMTAYLHSYFGKL